MYNTKQVIQDCEKYAFTVVHNRKATHGGVSDNTAHPFQVEHITLVHNGTLTNHRSLPRGSESSVDSKVVACALNTEEPDGATNILEQLQGAYVLIWHDTRDNSINIAKNPQRPWAGAFVEKEQVLLGASEGRMLQWLAERNDLKIGKIFTPADHTHYKWLLDEKDVRNYYYTEYTPKPVTSYPSYGNYYNNYNRDYEDRTQAAREARFAELEKLGFKRGQRVEFESYDFTAYSGSPSHGNIKGIDCTYAFDVECYNIRKDLYEGAEKLSGTIRFVKDTPSFPQWMTVVLDEVKPVGEETEVKKPQALVIVGEKSTESEVAKMMQREHEEERFVPGPGGVLIPLRENREKTRRGCSNCTGDFHDPSEVVWTFMEDPLCSECAELLDDNLNVGHC